MMLVEVRIDIFQYICVCSHTGNQRLNFGALAPMNLGVCAVSNEVRPYWWLVIWIMWIGSLSRVINGTGTCVTYDLSSFYLNEKRKKISVFLEFRSHLKVNFLAGKSETCSCCEACKDNLVITLHNRQWKWLTLLPSALRYK